MYYKIRKTTPKVEDTSGYKTGGMVVPEYTNLANLMPFLLMISCLATLLLLAMVENSLSYTIRAALSLCSRSVWGVGGW